MGIWRMISIRKSSMSPQNTGYCVWRHFYRMNRYATPKFMNGWPTPKARCHGTRKLTEEVGYKLIHAGLDKLIISIQSIEKEVYEETMRGLTFEKTLENVMKFVELKESRGTKSPDLEIWMVRTKYVEDKLKEHKAFWKDRGIKLKARKLNNQASSELEERMRARGDIPNDDWAYASHCSIPFWRACRRYDPVLCGLASVDGAGKYI